MEEEVLPLDRDTNTLPSFGGNQDVQLKLAFGDGAERGDDHLLRKSGDPSRGKHATIPVGGSGLRILALKRNLRGTREEGLPARSSTLGSTSRDTVGSQPSFLKAQNLRARGNRVHVIYPLKKGGDVGRADVKGSRPRVGGFPDSRVARESKGGLGSIASTRIRGAMATGGKMMKQMRMTDVTLIVQRAERQMMKVIGATTMLLMGKTRAEM